MSIVIDGVTYVASQKPTVAFEDDVFGRFLNLIYTTVMSVGAFIRNFFLVILVVAGGCFAILGLTITISWYIEIDWVALLSNLWIKDYFSYLYYRDIIRGAYRADSWGTTILNSFTGIQMMATLCRFYRFLTGYIPFIRERVMAHSPLIGGSKLPPFQFMVCDTLGNYIGSGFRIGFDDQDVIVTAYHNIRHNAQILLQSSTGKIILETQSFQTLPNLDVAYLPHNLVSSLNLAKARVGLLDSKMSVQISSKDSCSVGTLTPAQNIFGYLMYSGSTTGGFSGAPYVSGKAIYGIHIGTGGTANYGINMSFLNIMLKKGKDLQSDPLEAAMKTIKEDSYESILQLLEGGNELDWAPDSDPNTIYIRDRRGQYQELDTTQGIGYKIHQKLLGRNVDREASRPKQNSGKRVIRENAIPDSALPAVFVTAPSFSDQMGGCYKENPMILLRDQTSTMSISTPPTPSSVIVGPQLPPRQSGNHLTSTPESPATPINQAQTRESLIDALLSLAPFLPPGERLRLTQRLAMSTSTPGLKLLLTELSQVSIGRLQSASANSETLEQPSDRSLAGTASPS